MSITACRTNYPCSRRSIYFISPCRETNFLCERVLCRIRKRSRLVVVEILDRNADIFEDLEQLFTVVSESHCAVMRIVLLDQDVTVETAHLMDREDADAAEGPCRNGKDFSFRHIRAELAVRCGLQAEECDVAGRDIAFEGYFTVT